MSSPTKRVNLDTVKGQNIQVFVRCRPLNDSEKAQRSYSIVDTPNSREITVKEKQVSSLTKTFQFDRVFGIKSKQIEVYRSVVEPLIGQVMQGYNCTVFAYGQTGTGKTFTMEGGDGRDDPSVTWENDPTSGIIPRALAQLFDELRVQQEAEFSVRVSFLELYNEEIFDLLSAADDLNKLRLYEDASRKGSVIIQGLEEVQVHSKREVYSILEKGSKKRQTASTLMNAHSSRSHTVFTVTVHMKENSIEGEEVVRIGKLNLVDLAGSENVGRSGALDKRAREAGNINQSLLTLGRVITCLVERAPHIPYRESKLTRLLQDSLGGRTKTSIIATVSPAGINLEETLSTLDYAHRAKNITNKPQVNQKMSKRAVMKEYTEEIERLRKDLMASREKNGVFLANENYQQMLAQLEMQSQEIAEKIGHIKALNDEMTKKVEVLDELTVELEEKNAELESTTNKLSETEHTLSCTRTVLHKTAIEREEQKHLVEKHQDTESKLKEQAKKLLQVANVSTKEGGLLHDKLDRLKTLEDSNKNAKEDFSQVFATNIDEILTSLKLYSCEHRESCSKLKTRLDDQLEARRSSMTNLSEHILVFLKNQDEAVSNLDALGVEMSNTDRAFLDSRRFDTDQMIEQETQLVNSFLKLKINPVLAEIAQSITTQAEEIRTFKAALCSDIDELANKVKLFSGETVKNIDDLQVEINNYSTQNKARCNRLRAKNDAIRSSEEKIKARLEALMAEYVAHSKLVQESTSSITDTAAEEVVDIEKLLGKSEEISNLMKTRNEQTLQAFDDEKSQINTYVDASSDKFLAATNAVLDHRATLETSAQNYVVEAQGAWSTYKENSQVKAEQYIATLDNVSSNFDKVIASNKTDRENTCVEIKECVETMKDTDEAAVLNLATSVESVGDKCEQTMTDLKQRTTMEKETVINFVTDVLRVDEPTGQTPVRANRSYPHFLEATSPHERILHRFRAQAEAAVVAARLPLDDSDNDDSLVSASDPPLSRENSDVDIKRKNVGPSETKRSRPNSRSSSCSSSRQNSSSDLRGKYATSEIGSEIGDENHDPNFRKPNTKQPGKRTGVTGIKKPEVLRSHTASN